MSARYNLYIGNKMMGIPFFNAPWFDAAAAVLRKIPSVRMVFNPAEHDRANGFEPLNCPHGTAEEATAHGFDRRETLRADWSWIAKFSSGMIVGQDWMESTGAKSEVACHHALGLPVWEYQDFALNWDSPHLMSLVVHPLRPVFTLPHACVFNCPEEHPEVDGTEARERLAEIRAARDEEPDDGGFFCDCHG